MIAPEPSRRKGLAVRVRQPAALTDSLGES
jgi:hypothetical protein